MTNCTNKFIEFQKTLDETLEAYLKLHTADKHDDISKLREDFHRLNVKCLRLYNDILTLAENKNS